jgi:hypothetical protein
MILNSYFALLHVAKQSWSEDVAKQACIGGDEKVRSQEKDIQKLVCCFCLHQLMLFETLMVGPIIR